MISTLCSIPTDTFSIFARGSTLKPYFSDNSLTALTAFFISIKIPFFLGSIPKITFSAIVKGGINIKCWWTIPIPKLIATLGLDILTSFPLIKIWPSSAWYNPYKMLIKVVLPAPFSPTRAWISPLYTEKLTLSLANTKGKRLVIFFISKANSDNNIPPLIIYNIVLLIKAGSISIIDRDTSCFLIYLTSSGTKISPLMILAFASSTCTLILGVTSFSLYSSRA